MAWHWPLAIDLSVTGLTVALLALTSAEHSEVQAAEPAAVAAQTVAPVHVSVHAVTPGLKRAGSRSSIHCRGGDNRFRPRVVTHHRGPRPCWVRVSPASTECRSPRCSPSMSTVSRRDMMARKLSTGFGTALRIIEHRDAQGAEIAVTTTPFVKWQKHRHAKRWCCSVLDSWAAN